MRMLVLELLWKKLISVVLTLTISLLKTFTVPKLIFKEVKKVVAYHHRFSDREGLPLFGFDMKNYVFGCMKDKIISPLNRNRHVE